MTTIYASRESLASSFLFQRNATNRLCIQLKPIQQQIDLVQQYPIIQCILRKVVINILAIECADHTLYARVVYARVACCTRIDCLCSLQLRDFSCDVPIGKEHARFVFVEHFVDAGVFEAEAEALGEVVAYTVLLVS
jgi:hypothetical protein